MVARRVSFLVLLALILSAGCQQKPAVTAIPAPQPIADHSPLNRRLARVDFDATKLADVMAVLRHETESNIDVNWRALESAGISRNDPVTCHLRDVTLAAAMRSILSDLSGSSNALDFVLLDNVITVSTADDLRMPMTRVYDVRDLLIIAPDFESTDAT